MEEKNISEELPVDERVNGGPGPETHDRDKLGGDRGSLGHASDD